jgi:hypothetical protein
LFAGCAFELALTPSEVMNFSPSAANLFENSTGVLSVKL